MKNLIQIVLISLFSLPLWAANNQWQDYYIVEMIVFSNELRMYREEENWPNNEELTIASPMSFLEHIAISDVYPELYGSKNTTNKHRYVLPLLDQSRAQLTDAANKIKAAGRHRLLSHQVWLQKLDTKEKAQAIAVLAGQENLGFYEVSGSITLHKSRYLHIESNLWRVLFTNDPDEAINVTLPYISADTQRLSSEESSIAGSDFDRTLSLENDEEISFDTGRLQPKIKVVSALRHNRRMRSNEIHFLDHPLFGVIIQLTPYQK